MFAAVVACAAWLAVAMLAGCGVRQRRLESGDVRPLRAPAHDTIIPGLRAAVEAGRTRGRPVRLLTVHGMREHEVGFSADWQGAVVKRLTLEARPATPGDTISIPRGYAVTVYAGAVAHADVALPRSILRMSRYAPRGRAGPDALVVYELTWAPARDVVKYAFLGCFESRSPRDSLCSRTGTAQRNNDRRAGINGAAKDGLLVDGFADAAIVLSPLANVLQADLDYTLCRIATDALRAAGDSARAARAGGSALGCDLARLPADTANRVAAAVAAPGAPFFAITHSLGSFFVLDAQARADSVRADSARGRARTAAQDSALRRASEVGQVLDRATVYMWANQVALLNLARLRAMCQPPGGTPKPCPFRSPVSDTLAPTMTALRDARSATGARGRTYVAFNDVNDLLGFELPPYLGADSTLGMLINVSVQNRSRGIPRVFRHPGEAHTRQADNPAIVSAVVDGLPLRSQPAASRASRGYVGPLGLHLGGVSGPSLAAGGLLTLDCDPATHCDTRETSLLLAVEPGVRGGRASVGLVRQWGALGRAVSTRASVLERWRRDSGTYLGGELSAHALLFVGGRVGLFRAVARGRDRMLVTADLSLGF